jgi:hypothetical protein
LLALAALVAIWWWAVALVSTIRRRRRPPEVPGRPAEACPRWRRLSGTVAALTAMLALGTIALLALLPRLVDSGFLGWLDAPLAFRLILELPLALTVASGCLVAITAVRWRKAFGTRAAPGRDIALAAASLLVSTQLAVWHLIGWGFT